MQYYVVCDDRFPGAISYALPENFPEKNCNSRLRERDWSRKATIVFVYFGLTISLGSVKSLYLCSWQAEEEGRKNAGGSFASALWKLRYLRSCTGRIQRGQRERKDLRVISRMQLVNGHGWRKRGGGRAMVLDPIILPFSLSLSSPPSLCFAHSLRPTESRKFETAGRW